MKRGLFISFWVAAGTFASGCAKKAISEAQSVDIGQTPPKSQFRAEACWAYALTALVESDYFQRTGKTVDLSEEYLLAHSMADYFKTLANQYDERSLTDMLGNPDFIDYGAQRNSLQNPPGSDPRFVNPGGLELIVQRGVVPESAYSVKFANDISFNEKFFDIQKRMIQLLQGRDPKSISRDEIFEKVVMGSRAFPTPLPTRFDFDGRSFDIQEKPTGFLNHLGFQPHGYQMEIFNSEPDFDGAITAIKKTLARRIPVPMSFMVASTHYDAGRGAYDTSPTPMRPGALHAVLVTDFVNQGGKRGALSPESLAAEVSRPSSELSYLYVKDSLALERRAGQTSSASDRAEEGNSLLTGSYLKETLKVGYFTGVPQLYILIPKDVAAEIPRR